MLLVHFACLLDRCVTLAGPEADHGVFCMRKNEARFPENIIEIHALDSMEQVCSLLKKRFGAWDVAAHRMGGFSMRMRGIKGGPMI